MSRLFPMFVKLQGRRCLVVGAGTLAAGKIPGLLDSGARVRVVAIQASPDITERARCGQVELELKPFSPDDLNGVFLAVGATSSSDVNKAIYREASRRGVLCNIVDVPELCDFYYPAVVRRGELQIAISTNGRSPALAKRLREHLQQQIAPGYADWVAELGETRKLVLASTLTPDRKWELLISLASRDAVEAALAESSGSVKEGVA